MSKIDRLVVSRGPALCLLGDGFFFSRGDIVVDLKHDTADITSDAFGTLDEVQLGVKGTTKFQPIGEFEHLNVLWPYASLLPGKSIFGAEDTPLVIKPLDNTQQMVTFHAAAISKMPDLTFTAKDTLIGDLEIQMIGQNNTENDADNRLFTFADNDIAELPYDPTKLIIQAYESRWFSAAQVTFTFGANTTAALPCDSSAAQVQTAFRALPSVAALGTPPTVTGSLEDGWTITYGNGDGNVGQATAALTNAPAGSTVTATTSTAGVTGVTAEVQLIKVTSPWLSFESKEGVKVAFNMTTTEDDSDAIGMYDNIFNGLTVTVTCTPQGIDLATVLSAARVQGAASIRGRKLSIGAQDFRVTGEGVYFIAYGAQLDGGGIVRSSKNQTVPELTWKTSRSIGAGGTLNPLFYIGTEAPA